ncbi:MAG: FlgD immunoglobulin-like domain containing protein, partial [bacterium]
ASGPALAIDDSGTVYISWEDNQEFRWHIYMTRSTDGGETFDTADVRVDNDVFLGNCVHPSVALGDSGDVSVTWTHSWEDGNRIYFNKSTDGGITFDSTHVQVDDGSKDCYSSQLSMDSNGNLYVVWFAGWITRGTDVYFDKSTDGGVTFGTDVRVNDVDSTGFWPSLAVDGKGTIFTTWQDRSGDGDIYFAMSTDGGATFSEDTRVDHQEWGSGYPSIATDDSGKVYVVWEQQTQFYGVPDAIYLNKFNAFSTSGGPTSFEDELSTAYELAQNYPNPFNTTTHIRFQIPAFDSQLFLKGSRSQSHRDGVSFVSLKIYNILGQEVRSLVDEPQEAGHYSVSWDGRDDSGREVASGIYFYQLKIGSFAHTKRMLLSK